MKITPDDPRLTAYVLEELDEAERQAVGAAIHESDGLYQEAAGIRDAAQWLVDELQTAPLPGLAPGQVARIEDALRQRLELEETEVNPGRARASDREVVGAAYPVWSHWGFWLRWLGLATACLIGAFVAWKWWPAPVRRSLEVAQLLDRPLPPPPAIVTPQQVAPDDGSVTSGPGSPAQPAVPPAIGSTSGPMTDIRMMMRYGLLPKGFQPAPPRSANPMSPPPALTTPGSIAAPSSGRWPRGGGFAAPGEQAIGVGEHPFLTAFDHPLSTFGIDVDTASYSLVREYLGRRLRPDREVVRLEELVNYFPYDYAPPKGEEAVAFHVEIAGCPWAGDHRLVRLGLKARELAPVGRAPCNLVFLIDVSGSMAPADRLPLLTQALRLLVEKLTEQDSVSIVVYAAEARTVLWPTPGSERQRILTALDSLQAGGSTHGSAGIQTAYELAASQFRPGGANRVILCTDGDFNVGITDRSQLAALITQKARTGVFLTVLGVGMGNFRDGTAETLADRGNGNYAYIDTLNEAHKVLVEQLRATLVTVASDVKVQVEFNPATVRSYRLLGYENRELRARDFNDDRRDAGELGSGHQVTVLYEIVPAGAGPASGGVDPLKYQPEARRHPIEPGARSGDLFTLKCRYKTTPFSASERRELAVADGGRRLDQASADFRFAASVAAFGMILRESPHRGSASLAGVLELAAGAVGDDPGGYRAEFLELVRRAQAVLPGQRATP